MLSLNAHDYFESRAGLREAFLSRTVGAYEENLIAQDWASRRYFRIHHDNGPHVLMEAIPDHTGAFTPGHKVSDYLRLARFLRDAGINTPRIVAADEGEGYILLEDFGDTTMYAALREGANERDLYEKATDILIALRGLDISNIELPDYRQSHIHKGRQRIVDWYLPITRREKNADDVLASYLAAWDDVEKPLPEWQKGFVHGDYHAQNLMALKDGLGVLDFQAGMRGPVAYDLANLLEDMRRDVPDDIRNAMLDRYCRNDDALRAWYRVMATQFHCRMLGQIFRLAIVGKRPEFLPFIPRLQNYVRAAFKDPVLKPLAEWFAREGVDLSAHDFPPPEKAAAYIRDDAF